MRVTIPLARTILPADVPPDFTVSVDQNGHYFVWWSDEEDPCCLPPEEPANWKEEGF